jgi:hypothetical protein
MSLSLTINSKIAIHIILCVFTDFMPDLNRMVTICGTKYLFRNHFVKTFISNFFHSITFLQGTYQDNAYRCCWYGARLLKLDSPAKVECFKNAVTSEIFLLDQKLVLKKIIANAADFASHAKSFWLDSTRGGGDPDHIWCNAGGTLVDNSLWKGSTPPPNIYPCNHRCAYAVTTPTGFDLMEGQCDGGISNFAICEFPA